jgi:hypothetical protein
MKFVFGFIFYCLIYTTSYAQSAGESDITESGQLWTEVNFTHVVKKIIYQADFSVSSSNDKTKTGITNHIVQYGIRPWAHYFITPRIKLSTGIAFFNNPEIVEVNQIESFEIRPTFQLQHFKVAKRITLYNRLRFETRFIETNGSGDFKNNNRLRYMPKLFISLNSLSIRKKTIYAILSDELFMNFDKGHFIDMNRLNMGLGYCITDNISVELCYANQLKNPTTNTAEITNALSISLSFNNILKIIAKN